MRDLEFDLGSLRTFLAVARTGSITKAAGYVNLSQSAVSRRIQSLEESLGSPLFDRLEGQVYLSPAGRTFLPDAERILLRAEDSHRRLHDVERGDAGELRVGATVTAASYLFPGLLATYRRLHPGVRLVLRPAESEKLLAMIRRNDLDIAAVGHAVRSPGVKVWGLIRDRLFIVAPPDHPLAGRRGIDPRLLSNEDFILRDPSSGTRRMIEQWASSKGFTLKVLMDVWCPDTVKRLVSAGLGLTALPFHSVTEELRARKLALVGIRGFSLPVLLKVVTHREKRDSKALLQFVTLAKKELGKSHAWQGVALDPSGVDEAKDKPGSAPRS